MLSAAIEINKHHTEKGIRAERSAAPAERIWQEDGAMDIFGDIPERVNLGYERLAKAAASKKRRIAYCVDLEAQLARGETPKRRCGGSSHRLPNRARRSGWRPSPTARCTTRASACALQLQVQLYRCIHSRVQV